ncbi:MAG TPA: TatD family hydrolase [Pyrinomonadaceae bacterium]|jgi:TatD DNase family protein|nr:TatD family hydrolase [Pyrinomonadaceae bacterium]
MFIDSHAHIDGPEFDDDREEVLKRAHDAGVLTILNVGTGDPHSGALERAVEFGRTHENIYTAIGTHPHDARLYDDRAEEKIKALIRNERVIAWGEIGLDFHYDNSPREVQVEVFKRQLRAARECDLPVIIHTREAEAETIEILRSEYAGTKRGGIFHCFSGSLELAQAALDLGFMISFSGILTFKTADDLREVAEHVPLARMLIETDCPYLSPIPYRGKRNEPAYVIEVARVLGELYDVELEAMAYLTSDNFRRFFGL